MTKTPGRWLGWVALMALPLALAGCGGLLGSAGDEPQQPAPSASASAVATSAAPLSETGN